MRLNTLIFLVVLGALILVVLVLHGLFSRGREEVSESAWWLEKDSKREPERVIKAPSQQVLGEIAPSGYRDEVRADLLGVLQARIATNRLRGEGRANLLRVLQARIAADNGVTKLIHPGISVARYNEEPTRR